MTHDAYDGFFPCQSFQMSCGFVVIMKKGVMVRHASCFWLKTSLQLHHQLSNKSGQQVEAMEWSIPRGAMTDVRSRLF
jgi:hypothetical protein